MIAPERPEALHIRALADVFDRRTALNARYSLRAYARDLRLSPASLSGLLQGRKGLSAERAAVLAERIGLNGRDAQLFVLSAQAHHARKASDRTQAHRELASAKSVHHAEGASLEVLQQWYHLALLELMELPDCVHDVAWLAKRLGLNEKVTERALAQLVSTGHVVLREGRYVPAYPETTSPFDEPTASIQKFHASILDRANLSLAHDTVESREFLSTTFAFSEADMKEAKKEIREFQKRFAAKFYGSALPKTSVYQISIQFFRLDHEEDV